MTQASTQTLDQQRAQFARQCIRDLKPLGVEKYGNYVSYVSALPATIVMNGLGQALTTLLAKAGRKKKPKDDPHYFLFSHVAGWLSRDGEVCGVLAGSSDELVDRLMQSSQDVYVLAQGEAMAYLNWLKQFARAYLQEADLQEKEGQGDA